MRSNCGWAQLIDLHSDEAIARGRVFVSRPAEPLVTHDGHSDWRGEIDLLRAFRPILVSGTYALWFEGGHDQCLVGLGAVEAQFTPSGLRAHATLRSADSETPLPIA